MIILNGTTDKIQLVTDAAVTVDAHATYLTNLADGSGNPSPGSANTAISAAGTNDIVAAAGASNVRAVQTLNIRNKAATGSVTVTVVIDVSGTDYELHKAVLLPGDTLQWIVGVGWFKITDSSQLNRINSSVADQAIGASATAYLTGSALRIPSNVGIGTILRWTIQLAKTAASTATQTVTTRFGTAGTTSDTTRLTFTTDTETAVADEAVDTIQAIIRGPISASCIVEGVFMRDDNLTTTGFSNTARKAQVRQNTSSAFDITAAGLIAGICIASGASHALTIRQVVAELISPNS